MIFVNINRPKPVIMRKSSLIFVILIIIFSCEKKDIICNCNNPLEDIAWLKELKASFTNCTCQISIFQASYDKQTVFYSLMNDPLCNGITQQISILDCTGAALKTYSQNDQTFSTEVTDRKVIYSCKTNK
jgi:hypothetical protein